MRKLSWLDQHHQGKSLSPAHTLALAHTLTPLAEHFPLAQNQAPIIPCGRLLPFLASVRALELLVGAPEPRQEVQACLALLMGIHRLLLKAG